MNNYEEIKTRLKDIVLNKMDLTKDVTDEEIQEIIDNVVVNEVKSKDITIEEKVKLSAEIFNSIRRLDVLQELIDDNTITEIMVNGENNIFIERQGKINRWNQKFESKKKLEDVIQQIVSGANRIINELNPIVDARLENGSRVNVVLPPVAINGPIVTIRKFPDKPITIEKLIEIGSITKEAAEYLKTLVISGYNIFISGGTGSGKTTFLNAVSNFIPSDERIITIEDSAELQLQNIQNLVRLEVRNANVEGNNEISIRDLIKSSLRMRPDRIVVGEIRDGAALDLLTAYNTGHDGSLSTGHANSPTDMLARIETLVLYAADLPLLAVRKQIASAIDIIIHLDRLRDKTRKVMEIVEILDCIDGEIEVNKLFVFKEEGETEEGYVIGSLVKTNQELIHRSKLSKAGMQL
ncbi:pilus assembly protein CpaF [Mobilisporobacter senegalensis]|uniref:Pilus assembly protein CpaF n=2 Tax=Mobilisporobacter senegalensis TaxID=1329262 RepID=A0A3N1XAC9_9FIRM|nr:pilus assembly protein CpaF [Mobilisporobacter senegalensis]